MDKALLTRATSKDDAPTPGYLYGEIARMTQHSYDTCTKVMDFLVSRVKNKHHTVKFKALQVIKHVCREGRVDFKREMQKNIPIIKECLQFRGPPDPLKGDEYYRRVRDSAKECLDAIYDTDNAPGLGGMGMSARIQGMSNPSENAGASGSGWGSKLWGSKNANDTLPPPPGAGGYNGGQSYGYGSEPSQVGGYGGPQPSVGGYPGPQPPPYQPEYPYGGPTPGANAPPYGAPPPAPYGGGPSPFNEQKFSGIGNPMYSDARDEKGGLFSGLKEKLASKYSKNDGKPTFAGAPPGSANPPEGWSFATNRGPTGGSYGPNPGAYNPEEPYRPSGYAGGGYRAGSAAYGGSDPRESANSQLREKAYEGERKKGRVGGAWGSEAAPSTQPPVLQTMSSGGRDNRTQSFNNESRDARSYSHSRGPSSDYGYGDDNKPSDSRAYGAAAPSLTGSTSGAQSDGSYERNLVSALCAPGGMRAVPPKDKMDAFLKSALTLDPEIVGPILEDCLADEQWTVVSKALSTIDALLKTDGCEDFNDYFTENASEIEECSKSDKAAVRDRAVKILAALGLSSGGAATASSRPAPKARSSRQASGYQQPRQQETDLLGDFDEPAPSDGNSLFSGLQPSSVPQQPAAPAPQPAPTSTSDVVDMFGGLQLQSSGASTASAPEPVQQASAPAPAPAPAAASPSLILDPLLEPVPAVPQMTSNYGNAMGMGMMNYGAPQMNQMAQMQQMQQMQYMQQMQQMQQMQFMQMQGSGVGMPIGVDGRARMGSQVIGAAMTPSGYIAKTIQEPSDGLSDDSGFGFMKKKDDSFNFVKDAMKNS